MTGKAGCQQGFSLLEILIAFSILAFSLGILLNIFSGGLRRTIVSEEYQQAVIIAQSKLAAVGVEGELEGLDEQGTIQDKFFWSAQAQPFNMEEMGLDDDKTDLMLYQVTVRVKWSEGNNERHVELMTLRPSKKQ